MAGKDTKAERKILRIGIIQGGKIIDERLLRKRSSVTIGQSLKNTFVVVAPNLPKTFTLFQPRGAGYVLTFTDQMDGRLSVKDSVQNFATLKSQGVARKRGTLYQLALSEQSRGKVNFGDVILLFQFVTPPPEPVRATLPAVARGGFVKGIDWVYTTVVMVSFVAHFGTLAYLKTVPVPEDMQIEDIPDRFARLIIQDIKKDEPKKTETEAEQAIAKEEKEEKKEDTKKPDPKEKPQNDEEAVRAAARHRLELEKKVAGKGLLKLIGTTGDGATGDAVADVFSQGGLDSDIDNIFEGTAGVEVATTDAQTSRRGGGTGGDAATIADLATAGGGSGKVAVAQKVERTVSGTIKSEAPEVDGGDLDPAKIAKVVSTHKSAVKSCYENALKKNPTLKGKIVVRFTVAPAGRVTDVSIENDTLGSPDVASCITSLVKRWRFPAFEGDETTVAYPFIFAPAG